MSNRRQLEISRLLIVFGLAAGSFGGKCSGVPVELANLPCSTKTAQIIMWDGKIQRICGCGGVDGEFAAPSTPLTCTFPLGNTAFISYQGPFLQHQFVSVGTPALPNGPVFDPSAKEPIRAHAFTPIAAGTYQFKDEYDDAITGTIIVTP